MVSAQGKAAPARPLRPEELSRGVRSLFEAIGGNDRSAVRKLLDQGIPAGSVRLVPVRTMAGMTSPPPRRASFQAKLSALQRVVMEGRHDIARISSRGGAPHV